MNPELFSTLHSAISENDSHAEKIQKARKSLAASMPLTVKGFQQLKDETITHVDQFIYRFTKMQDSLGTRFFPALYNLLEGTDRPVPFLDVLNRLEQLSVIESVDTWQFFRELRNRLAHDYPESVGRTVETLNLLYDEVEKFLFLYFRAREICLARI